MGDRYDVAIVGSGPAGLSAAINCKIRNKNIIIFGQKNLSNKVCKAPLVSNYLGVMDVVGQDLNIKFQEHIDKMDIKLTYERINTIYSMGEYFALMAGNDMYEASTVIVATGIEFTTPLPGENEFLGRGVGYCATCDAPLYRGKTMTIVGYSSEAEEEANFVSELASKVYYVPMYSKEYRLNKSIEVVTGKPIKIEGSEHAEKLFLKDKELMTDVIFLLKDSVPPGQLVPGLKIEEGHIEVNRKMETNITGLYAAGDCTGKPYQYMKSAGEGQVAALNAVAYLDKK